jgi:capsule polysaccharide export protein KpsE/RkpR
MIRLSALIVAGFVGLAATGVAQQVPAAKGGDRVALERQVRERTAKLLQERLGLSDAQMKQLEATNQKFAPQLAHLAGQERETRRQLRNEMQATSPNQQHVSDLLDASIRLQRQRLTIVEAEQKELSGFLTPVQRARYAAFQAQLRRRAEELSRPDGPRRGGGMQRRNPGGR